MIQTGVHALYKGLLCVWGDNNTSFPRYYINVELVYRSKHRSRGTRPDFWGCCFARGLAKRVPRKKRIKQTVRQTFNPSKYNSFVKTMLQDKPIWNLTSGTCWMMLLHTMIYQVYTLPWQRLMSVFFLSFNEHWILYKRVYPTKKIWLSL